MKNKKLENSKKESSKSIKERKINEKNKEKKGNDKKVKNKENEVKKRRSKENKKSEDSKTKVKKVTKKIEKKVKEKEGKKGKKKIKLSRVYTVPLRVKVSRARRTRTAMHNLKKFVMKHMKSDDVKISKEVNEKIWERGYKKPPSKIRILVEKDEADVVYVKLKK